MRIDKLIEYSLENGILNCGELEIIQAEAFAERQDITRVILTPSVREIGGASFAGCENLKSVVFADDCNLKLICDGAFTLCHSLREFQFRGGLKEIGEMAFWETELTSVTLPESVESVGESAFWSCSKLVEANVLNKNCRIDSNVFGDCCNLKKGFIAPGYYSSSYYNQADELVYTLLWLSCPEKHSPVTGMRARRFIREQELIIMEMILERNNTPAMTGLVEQGLISDSSIDRYIEKAHDKGLTEITNLLLETRRKAAPTSAFDEFEL